MSKCIHGIYMPSWVPDGECSPYCSASPTFGKVLGEVQNIHLPTNIDMMTGDRLRANGFSRHGCPACGSQIYSTRGEDGQGKRRCGDCDREYTGPASTKSVLDRLISLEDAAALEVAEEGAHVPRF